MEPGFEPNTLFILCADKNRNIVSLDLVLIELFLMTIINPTGTYPVRILQRRSSRPACCQLSQRCASVFIDVQTLSARSYLTTLQLWVQLYEYFSRLLLSRKPLLCHSNQRHLMLLSTNLYWRAWEYKLVRDPVAFLSPGFSKKT